MVSRRQLRALGLGESAIETSARRGYLLPIHRGVYAVGHSSLTVEGRWMAAVLACGPGAVLSHRSAGQLWGVVSRFSIEPEVTRPRKFRGIPGIRAHHAALPADEVGTVLDIPVTSAPRTVFDLAAVQRPRQVERAFNQMEVLRLTDPLSLPDLIERHPGSRGVAALPPRGRLLEVNCVWRAQRLIVELDGRDVHGTGRAFESDRRRDRELLVAGWRSARVTWRQLSGEPETVAADLRRLLGGRR